MARRVMKGRREKGEREGNTPRERERERETGEGQGGCWRRGGKQQILFG